jgi:hypothetical protein
MKKLALFLTILLIAVSCKKMERTPIGPTDIRVRNVSLVNMSEVTVETGGGTYNFGLVAKDAVTEYHRYEKAYVVANISAIINGQLYKTDTAIYTYKQYLGPDKVTYEVEVLSDANRKLGLHNIIHESPIK